MRILVPGAEPIGGDHGLRPAGAGAEASLPAPPRSARTCLQACNACGAA